MTPPGPPLATVAEARMPPPKEQFLEAFEREHVTTMKVLRAYPPDQLELRPHPTARSARELGWVFAVEAMLGGMVFKDEFAAAVAAGGSMPAPPETWDEILAGVEAAHAEYAALLRSASEPEMFRRVRFFTGPGTLGEIRRIDWLWFLLSDEIHHRGQMSVYLRMAGGKVPSIYGPSGDEPWT